MFDVKGETENIIAQMKSWFNNYSGQAKGIIIGISGGKDSTIVGKLWCNAIGEDRVFGVMMPNGKQKDIKDAKKVCKILNINNTTVNIKDIYDKFLSNIDIDLKEQSQINISPRIRMSVLYAIGTTMEYRVTGTSNLSEIFMGYYTKYGDNANDFSPIANYTCTEVIQIGKFLGLPDELINKPPSDGLTGNTDEDVLGFTYEQIDNVIRGTTESLTKQDISDIMKVHDKNLHKLATLKCNRLEG